MTSEEKRQKVLERVRKAVQNLKNLDDEAAHAREDDIYHLFVHYVAKDKGPWAEIAREILMTETMNFSRWYA